MNFYIHIPFCRQKCPYCKFALTPIFDESKKRRYLAHLKNEIQTFFEAGANGAPINTIYFGGGTPSVLSLEEVASIFDCFPIFGHSNIPTLEYSNPLTLKHTFPEITFECNPEDITSEYISGLFNLGINRLSIGVQSLNDETLKAIHRSDRESIFHALEAMSSVLQDSNTRTFQPSITTDFILGLPFSKPGETLENIQELHRRFPFISHTSVYMLEDGLYPKEWKSSSMSEEAIGEEYSQICQYFASLGWHHYEISSWSRSGYECRHNQGYWDHTDYRGFGLSATSYEDQRRWENSASFAGYYRGEIVSDEILSGTELELEKIIFDIRTFSLKERGFDDKICEKLEREKKILRQDGKILLTSTGIFQENSIIAELISHIRTPKSE